MNSLLLTGSTGRLGSTVQKHFNEWVVHPCSRSRGVDLTASLPENVFLKDTDFCLNCAAVSSRGGCLNDPVQAFRLNAQWPARLADFCLRENRRLVHMSTDLVYAGGTPPYTESSSAVPKSIYGWTKLLGDMAVLRRDPRALVVRTSVLTGEAGARTTTFTEDILQGRATCFFVDSFRNHTDIGLLADYLERALLSSRSGLVLAAAPWAMSRAAYAWSVLEKPMKMIPAPDHIAKDLTLRPSVSLTNN